MRRKLAAACNYEAHQRASFGGLTELEPLYETRLALELGGMAPFEIVAIKGAERETKLLFSKWNSFSRVGVYDYPHQEWSLSPKFTGSTGPSPGTKLIHSGGYNYQLFDLASDPEEKKDLARDKEKRDEAIGRMNAFRARLKEIEVKPK